MLDRRSLIRNAVLAGLAAPLLASCEQRSGAPKKARLFLNWLYTASFAGEVLAARDFAKRHGIEIELQVGGEGRDPIRLVGDGDIGTASADDIIRAIELGAPISIIGVLSDTHPAAFVSLKSSGITTPKSFEGKRVGILPFGATGLVYEALMAKAGVDRTKVSEVVVSPDLRPFISGKVTDVQPVFMYDEPVTLEEQGIAYNVIDPREYGVNFKGQCYFATHNTIKENPDLVVSVLRALIQGWWQARETPDKAVAALKELSPSLEAESETKRLKRALPYFVTGDRSKLLQSDPASWHEMIAALVSSKVIKAPMDPASFLKLDLLNSAQSSNLG